MLEIGSQFLNYKIISLLGEGGMATVYEGQNIGLTNRKVAIKVLNPMFSTKTDIKKRFQNEAEILSSLQHPNIVSVWDYAENNNILAIIMEYIQGETLNITIKNATLTENAKKDIFLKILDAFQYAHNKGIIHRDIKPSNVIIMPDNTPKILDFGIAKIVEEGGEYSMTGAFMGTLTYMSPEQIKDSKYIDQRSDIYSLAVLYYTMILGKKPYDENTTSKFDIQTNIVKNPLPDLHLLPIETRKIIEKATEKNPNDRYDSCKSFMEALQNINVINEIKITKNAIIDNSENTTIDTQKEQQEPQKPKLIPSNEIEKPKNKKRLRYFLSAFVFFGFLFLLFPRFCFNVIDNIFGTHFTEEYYYTEIHKNIERKEEKKYEEKKEMPAVRLVSYANGVTEKLFARGFLITYIANGTEINGGMDLEIDQPKYKKYRIVFHSLNNGNYYLELYDNYAIYTHPTGMQQRYNFE